jgi:2'-5' RNA ligase
MQTAEKTYFTAVPIPPPMKRKLYEWKMRVRGDDSFRKWVYEEDYHITLKYLGACDSNHLHAVMEQLERIQGLEPFTLRLSGIGFFGRRENPRILWAGVAGEMDKLHALQSQVETAMTAIGFESENRPYRPHVTIAKNYLGEKFDMKRWTDRWDEEMGTLPEWTVESIVLYRTDLGSKPMYKVEGVYPITK